MIARAGCEYAGFLSRKMAAPVSKAPALPRNDGVALWGSSMNGGRMLQSMAAADDSCSSCGFGECGRLLECLRRRRGARISGWVWRGEQKMEGGRSSVSVFDYSIHFGA